MEAVRLTFHDDLPAMLMKGHSYASSVGLPNNETEVYHLALAIRTP